MLTESPDISVRPSSGAGIWETALASPRFFLERVCRIILIHGFRNSEPEAMESYNLFKFYFSRYAGIFSDKVFSFVWPGDHFGANPLRYFDYNAQNSLEAGAVLGRYLVEIISKYNLDSQFIIVAHSLGCRLTAAMIHEVHRLDPDICKRFKIVLMAGAVPVDDVADPKVFRTSLEAVGYTANLYSSSDQILRLLFPTGELGGWRSASEPIGLNGGPKTFAWTELQDMSGFGHSDYWRKSAPAEFVARLVGANIDGEIPANEVQENLLFNHQVG